MSISNRDTPEQYAIWSFGHPMAVVYRSVAPKGWACVSRYVGHADSFASERDALVALRDRLVMSDSPHAPEAIHALMSRKSWRTP